MPAPAAGSITILAGYSAAGKSTALRALLKEARQEKADEPTAYLVEDKLYVDPRIAIPALIAAMVALHKDGALITGLGQFIGSLFQREIKPPDVGIRAFYRVVHDELFRRARAEALKGKRVYVDVCPGHAADFVFSVRRHETASTEMGISSKTHWLSCPRDLRRRRIESRGTRFDAALAEDIEPYLDNVDRAEAHIHAHLKTTPWLAPATTEAPQKGGKESIIKRLFFADWAARAHMELLRNFKPAA